MIGLWDGLELEKSHRHHSHLAGLYPFDTLDINDKEWRDCPFRGIHAEEFVLVDGCRDNFKTREIILQAEEDAAIKVANPFTDDKFKIIGDYANAQISAKNN